jgi:Cu/Zn superoxide dismutase
MKLFRIIGFVSAAAVAMAGVAFAQGSMQSSGAMQTIKITMWPQNKSNQPGTATLTDTKNGVMVSISLRNEPPSFSEPAHIHQGVCTKLNPAPWKPLNNVANGKSMATVAGVTVKQLLASPYAINVHLSSSNLGHYVACGNIAASK